MGGLLGGSTFSPTHRIPFFVLSRPGIWGELVCSYGGRRESEQALSLAFEDAEVSCIVATDEEAIRSGHQMGFSSKAAY
jgi:hypothetical protein